MPPNRFESEVESFLEGSHGDRTHIKRADHHTVTPLCGTLLGWPAWWGYEPNKWQLVPLNERVCLKGDWISMRTRILAG